MGGSKVVCNVFSKMKPLQFNKSLEQKKRFLRYIRMIYDYSSIQSRFNIMKKLFDKLESNVMVHENLTMQYYDISLYFLL